MKYPSTYSEGDQKGILIMDFCSQERGLPSLQMGIQITTDVQIKDTNFPGRNGYFKGQTC